MFFFMLTDSLFQIKHDLMCSLLTEYLHYCRVSMDMLRFVVMVIAVSVAASRSLADEHKSRVVDRVSGFDYYSR